MCGRGQLGKGEAVRLGTRLGNLMEAEMGAQLSGCIRYERPSPVCIVAYIIKKVRTRLLPWICVYSSRQKVTAKSNLSYVNVFYSAK